MSPLSKTRILYINHTGHVSGAERVLLDTLKAAKRGRFEPIVMCPADGDLAEEIFAERVEWLPLPSIRVRFALRPDQMIRALSPMYKAVVGVRKQIRAIIPDLIHANSVRAGIVATLAAAGTGTPVIWHVHDTLPRHPVSVLIRMFAYAFRRTRLIAVSRATARRFCGRFPIEGKVRVIHNGVDLARFAPDASGGRAFREELGLSDGDFLVCAVGQICERKGLLELLDALRRIRMRVPHVHLAIVGKVVFRHEESYLRRLRDSVKSWGLEDRVHFCGERTDVPSVLKGSDLLVLNSRDEPFGLVLVEAMACGTPVLAARVGGIPEIISDAENGWLVEPGNPEALASRLLQLSSITDELRRVADHAQRVSCREFSLERYQNELTAAYAELMSRRDKSGHREINPVFARSGNR